MIGVDLYTYTGNTVLGRDSNAVGNNSTIIGYHSITKGDNNTVTGCNNKIKGSDNIISGYNNKINGDNNIINARNLILIGNNYVISQLFRDATVINDQLTYNILLFFYNNDRLINDVIKYFLTVVQHVTGGIYCYYHQGKFILNS